MIGIVFRLRPSKIQRDKHRNEKRLLRWYSLKDMPGILHRGLTMYPPDKPDRSMSRRPNLTQPDRVYIIRLVASMCSER